jgi:pyrrolidone-carboxylate peptidase
LKDGKCVRLKQGDMSDATIFSEDPGRYLCNQVFVRAMDHLARNGIEIPAGFIHLPLESDFPTDPAVAALSEALATLTPRCEPPPPQRRRR